MRTAASLTFLTLLCLVPGGHCTSSSATQTASAAFYPAAKLSVPATAPLTVSGNFFSPYSATLPVSYRARSSAGGGGAITLRVAADFTPAGGPSAAGGALTYVCGGATLGTGCSGTQTANTTSQTPVLTLPASACTGGGAPCSASDPNSVSLQFTLTNDPGFSTGSYSAQITFVISAT